MTTNEKAANWLSDRLKLLDKREEFKAALLALLPDGDFDIYCDYDPFGILLEAIHKITPCRGYMFSADGIFPFKTGIIREGDKLFVQEGYGDQYKELK